MSGFQHGVPYTWQLPWLCRTALVCTGWTIFRLVSTNGHWNHSSPLLETIGSFSQEKHSLVREPVPRPNPLMRKGSGVTKMNPCMGLGKCWSLLIVSVELQIGHCSIMTVLLAVQLKYLFPLGYYCNKCHSAIWLYPSGASPRIWTCHTRPLLLVWAGWGPGTRLGEPWTWKVH